MPVHRPTFRLKSSDSNQEFVILARYLEGYWLRPEKGTVSLYTSRGFMFIEQHEYSSRWDNWDEFIEQLKNYFADENQEV